MVNHRIGEGFEPSFVYDTLMDPNSLHFVDYSNVLKVPEKRAVLTLLDPLE